MFTELIFDEYLDNKLKQLQAANIIKLRYNMMFEFTQQPSYEIPWLFFTATVGGRDCWRWQNYFKHFKLVPSFCRTHCWKVVCKPRTVYELKRLHDTVLALPYHFPQFILPPHGKCGIDRRDYTLGAYAGFFYALSKEHAQSIYNIIHALITEHMDNTEINGSCLSDTLHVKRACTEMEGECPTDQPIWNSPPPQHRLLETRLDSMFYVERTAQFQADWHKNRVIYSWLKHAIMIGDSTADDLSKLICENEKLTPKIVRAVTYNPGDDAQLEQKENNNGPSHE